MSEEVMQIPFTSFKKQGRIEVVYKANTSPVTSGFEILADIVPDLNMCIGYPTIHASVKEYPGLGYSRYCGWIQVLRMEFYSDKDKNKPDDIHYDVDVTPVMKENRVPFFAFGYPAVLFDAPCNNFFDGPKLVWKADTYLIDMPSYINNNSISYLAGFRWGYTEYNSEGKKRIDIAPLEPIDRASWEQHFEMFGREFLNWRFA